MSRVMQAWKYLCEKYSLCCGESPTEDAEGHAHSEDWTDSYPSNDEMDPELVVEVGLKLRPDGVHCYYLIDTGHSCDTIEFGDEIPYPEGDDSWDEWATKIESVRETAAEEAYNAGLRSCLGCGDHYNIEADPEGCGCDEE